MLIHAWAEGWYVNSFNIHISYFPSKKIYIENEKSYVGFKVDGKLFFIFYYF
jgi:hypothetical protein